MLINIIKFVHLLCVLGILGSVIYCLISFNSTKLAAANGNFPQHINKFSKMILRLSGIAIITGTLLIYPKNFTFHTPWIQAAFILMLAFNLGIFFLKRQAEKNNKITPIKSLLFKLTYLILITLLIFVIHDAVTKTTFLF